MALQPLVYVSYLLSPFASKRRFHVRWGVKALAQVSSRYIIYPYLHPHLYIHLCITMLFIYLLMVHCWIISGMFSYYYLLLLSLFSLFFFWYICMWIFQVPYGTFMMVYVSAGIFGLHNFPFVFPLCLLLLFIFMFMFMSWCFPMCISICWTIVNVNWKGPFTLVAFNLISERLTQATTHEWEWTCGRKYKLQLILWSRSR